MNLFTFSLFGSIVVFLYLANRQKEWGSSDALPDTLLAVLFSVGAATIVQSSWNFLTSFFGF